MIIGLLGLVVKSIGYQIIDALEIHCCVYVGLAVLALLTRILLIYLL